MCVIPLLVHKNCKHDDAHRTPPGPNPAEYPAVKANNTKAEHCEDKVYKPLASDKCDDNCTSCTALELRHKNYEAKLLGLARCLETPPDVTLSLVENFERFNENLEKEAADAFSKRGTRLEADRVIEARLVTNVFLYEYIQGRFDSQTGSTSLTRATSTDYPLKEDESLYSGLSLIFIYLTNAISEGEYDVLAPEQVSGALKIMGSMEKQDLSQAKTLGDYEKERSKLTKQFPIT